MWVRPGGADARKGPGRGNDAEGGWELLDPGWAAGHVERTLDAAGRPHLVWRQRYAECYWLMAPAQASRTHHPEDSEWQLLGDRPVSHFSVC